MRTLDEFELLDAETKKMDRQEKLLLATVTVSRGSKQLLGGVFGYAIATPFLHLPQFNYASIAGAAVLLFAVNWAWASKILKRSKAND